MNARDVREALADLLMSDRVMRTPAMGRDYAYVEADAILAAFPTLTTPPPADDVREAMEHLDVLNESGRIQYADYVALHDMVSRIEVRPRGTVTDAEVDAAYRAHEDAMRSGENSFEAMRAALEATRERRS